MRNLEVVKSLILPSCAFLEDPVDFTVDVDSGDVWILDKNGIFNISSRDKVMKLFPILKIRQLSKPRNPYYCITENY